MARRIRRPPPAGELRAQLLAEAVAFRQQYAHEPVAWRELSKPVDQLAGEEPYRLCRFQLPDDHPDVWPASDPNDTLVLGTDDTLTLIKSPTFRYE